MTWADIAAHIPWDAVWGFVGTILGGIIGFVSGYVGTSRTVQSQKELQQAQFEREDMATRAIVSALLVDVYRYVEHAARNAVFEQEKWPRPLQRLLDFIGRIELGHALTQEQVQAVLSAGFEADLAFNELSEEIRGQDHPFSPGFEKRHRDVDLDNVEEFYVFRILRLSRDAYKAFNQALQAMGLERYISQEPHPSVVDIRDDYRSQIGRMPVERKPGGDTIDRALE